MIEINDKVVIIQSGEDEICTVVGRQKDVNNTIYYALEDSEGFLLEDLFLPEELEKVVDNI